MLNCIKALISEAKLDVKRESLQESYLQLGWPSSSYSCKGIVVICFAEGPYANGASWIAATLLLHPSCDPLFWDYKGQLIEDLASVR